MRPTAPPRVAIDVLLSAEEWRATLFADARDGLSAPVKALSPVWFYDERGSELFTQITKLAEYHLTRSEVALLEDHAAEIAGLCRADVLVEFGSGTSDKSRLLLDAMGAGGTLRQYVPLDVSEATLRAAAATIARDYPALQVHGLVADFRRDLRGLPGGARRLVCFLGSTIGNLDPPARRRFLAAMRAALHGGDALLVGVDLVQDPARLLPAYDDAAGVTARFNRNALHVLNRRLDGDFQPGWFDHVAVWDPRRRWIEMRLRAQAAHDVHLRALGMTVRLERGEEIRTEISAKFTLPGITEELIAAGLPVRHAWASDDYALVLAAAQR